jgi:hypothetical protein
MIVEKFSEKIVKSGIFNTFIATGFFAILIFFVLNSDFFTPLEMTIGTIIVTIVLKGLSNIMFSLMILLFDLQNNQEEYTFKEEEEKLNFLMNELSLQEAKSKTVTN